MYEAILPGLHEIAIGQRASTRFKFQLTEIGTGATFFWTAEELGVEHIVEGGSLVDEFREALLEQMLIFYIALKADCPYDLY